MASAVDGAAAVAAELPTTKTPGWEFTPLDRLQLEDFDVDAAIDPGHAPLLSEPGLPELPEGVTVAHLRDARELADRWLGTVVPADADVFTARNAAHWGDGLVVHVPRNVVVSEPIRIVATHSHWRTLVVLEEGAQAEVWEEYRGAAGGLLNAVTELVVGPAANLRYVCAQSLAEDAWVFASQRAEVERDAHLEWVVLGFGSANGKVRTDTKLAGRGSSAKVTGAYATRGRQHIDFDTTQEHAAENTVSDLAFRGLLDGRSSAVWRGMIKVDPGAQQTDAFQESRNLLLSKRAHADAIPGLEIEANDVRCTHAAAVAQIDREQLFYLHAHGLPDEVARRLVIEGFLQELVERFPEGALHEALSGALDLRLAEILDNR